MATLTCPVGFIAHPSLQGQCVPECPTNKGFEIGIKNGVAACVYTSNREHYYTLQYIPAVSHSGPDLLTLEHIRNSPIASIHSIYATATSALTTSQGDRDRVLGQIGRETLVEDAFKYLMDTEKTRNTDPTSYENAKFRYYALDRGDEWAAQERDRVATADATEAVAKYTNLYTDAVERRDKQKQSLDVIDGVKSNLLTLKDNFQYSVGAFAKQIRDLKNQIQIERAEKQTQTTQNWLDIFLNVIIVVLFIAVVWLLVRKIQSKNSTAYTQSSYVYGR